jgi:hypothetical protein
MRRPAAVLGTVVLSCTILFAQPADAATSRPTAGPTHRQPPGAYMREPDTNTIEAASEGDTRVVLWGRRDGELYFDRFHGMGAPLGKPTRVGPIVAGISRSWWRPALAIGNGYVFASARVADSAGHGYDFTYRVTGLFDPGNHKVPLTGTASGSVGRCGEPDNDDSADLAVAWDGSDFVVVSACVHETTVFRVSTAGAVSQVQTLRGADVVELSSAPDRSLLVYAGYSSDGHVVVRAQRLDASEAALGGSLTLAVGLDYAYGTTLAVARSADRYLTAWSIGRFHDDEEDLLTRTVDLDGDLGPARVLDDGPGSQRTPTLLARPRGTWLAAWSDRPTSGDAGIHGSIVSADGIAAPARSIIDVAHQDDVQPSLVAEPSGAASLTWVRDLYPDLGLTRALDETGVPTGGSIVAARTPVPQDCADIASGNGQYLATWQETREGHSADVYGQRLAPDGTRLGPVLRLTSAPGDQQCPRAAWNGSRWLVVWTDLRSGSHDVYGTTVGPDGMLLPTSGFPIGVAAGAQRSPAVSADGGQWVVAWEDWRRGNQDIYAARVAADRTVLDPAGIAVSSAPGTQAVPTVASALGSTVIGWKEDGAVQRRVLRADGRFIGGVVKVGVPSPYYSDVPPVATASRNRLAIGFVERRESAPFEKLTLALVDPRDGSVAGRRDLDPLPAYYDYSTLDLAFDGSRFVVHFSEYDGVEAGAVWFATCSADGTVRRSRIGFFRGRVASLPNGTSLALGPATFNEPTLAVAPVVDAP